jgi:hypothetical protein
MNFAPPAVPPRRKERGGQVPGMASLMRGLRHGGGFWTSHASRSRRGLCPPPIRAAPPCRWQILACQKTRLLPCLILKCRCAFLAPASFHSRQRRHKVKIMSALFVQFPPQSILCHYAEHPEQGFGVVSAVGKFLAPSFFELRHQFTFVCSISGAGGWVVLAPVRSSSFQKERANQPALF